MSQLPEHIFVDKSKKYVYTCGDIHGDFDKFLYSIKKHEITDSIIIVAGDCGFGFHKQEYYRQVYNKFEKILVKLNTSIFFVRGNHDDPAYFNKSNDFSLSTHVYWKFIPDYCTLHIGDKSILCIGGATSVDRSWRITEMESNPDRKLYWKDEAIFFDSYKLQQALGISGRITHVITHTAPTGCFPYDNSNIMHWLEEDPGLLIEISEERCILDMVRQCIATHQPDKIKAWIHGHFHKYCFEHIDDIQYISLDTHQFYEIK